MRRLDPLNCPRLGLSGKLLGLTVCFVMLAEVLIYLPSIGNYYERWLADRIGRARAVALVLDAAPTGMVPDWVSRQLLQSVDALVIVLKTDDSRRLLARSEEPPTVAKTVDLRSETSFMAIGEALATLVSSGNRVLRVVGQPPMGGGFVELVIEEKPLREALLSYSANVLLLSLLISGITAALIYFALDHLILRPVRRLTEEMVYFGQAPTDPARIVAPTRRADEIGVAECELAAMQREIHAQLQSGARLAALGLAVAKINHDLRSILTSAQLFSERLESATDPTIRRVGEKLLATLHRAADYCRETLEYGRAREAPPRRRRAPLEAILAEAREALALDEADGIGWSACIERDLEVDADPEQMFRVFLNLLRNARQALEARGDLDPARDQIRVVGRREGAVVVVEVADTGPGLSARAREHLFAPFTGSSRSGGTGLGLAIAFELVRAHGGDLRLVDGTLGATFRITIPDRPIELRPAAARLRA
ncbi:MAG TPA: HAMP domain-containing sensor histidine kinase [Hyphomicrobiales bacterium]|nr:HAMP domain-containing sensor histidine kinase [Hyphomicrobiales bacterium]